MAKEKQHSMLVPTPKRTSIEVTAENIIAKPGPEYRSVYANNVALGISAFDISLVFGEIMGSEDGKTVNVEQRVRVTMSPQHAKALVMVLAENLHNYEKNIGPIPLPETILAHPKEKA
jgi:hypothetical protein